MSDAAKVHALISITRLAEITGVTPRALRYYEEAGLVQPHRTPAGVRCFTPDQCERVAMIVRLRRCDVPVDIIHDLVAGPAPSADQRARLRAVLRGRAQDLTRKLEEVAATLAAAA